MSGLLIFCILYWMSSFAVPAASSKIHPDLSAALQNNGVANVVVTFKNGITNVLQHATLLQRSVSDRSTRNRAILDSLDKHADEIQAGVIELLTTQRSTQYYKIYKSANIVYVKGATRTLVEQLAGDGQVDSIRREPVVRHVAYDDSGNELRSGLKTQGRGFPGKYLETPDWNLRQIQVPEAWDELGGRKGDGVIIASIDNGARLDHLALKDSYLGEYGWFDPISQTTSPRDMDGIARGHGTNVMGIMVGSKDVGIAPGARWMACAACNRSCQYEHLRDCIQWMECPTLPDGSKKDCSKAPNIINNSWVSVRGETGYNEDVLRWRALGIIPVWAISNNGPGCETTASPAEQSFVIGVGGTALDGSWFGLSGVGPAPDGTIKPDIIAPGKDVLSASAVEPDIYNYMMGTSVAAPHVSGVVALLLTRNLNMTYEQVYTLLTENTDQECPVNRHSGTCSQQTEDAFPNNFCGFGRVNALKAVKAQTKLLLEAKNK